MKSEVVSEPAGTAPANAVATVTSGRLATPEVDDDDAQELKETPTEANRARALAAESPDDEGTKVGPGSPGVYRMVRPSVTDVVESPSVPRADQAVGGKRIIIGAARIRR